MKRLGISIATIALALGCSGPVCADDHEGFEQHGKHEHGTATLSIAVNDNGAEIFLDSPAINLAGFEHMPASDDDKEHLDDIVKKLEDGNGLFTLSTDAGCELKDTEVLSGLLGDQLASDGQAADAASTDSQATPSTEPEHQDMQVTWAYACTDPARLKEIKTGLFGAFPEGFRHIHVEWVTGFGSSATELTQDDSIRLE